MPTYQYRCGECGGDLEVVQRFSDAALTECPTCAGPLRKVYNAVGVVFKGSGFYRTDSRAGNGSGDGGRASEKAERTDSPSAGDGQQTTEGAKTGAKTDGTKTDGSKTDGSKTNGAGKPAKQPAEARTGGASSRSSTAS